MKRVSLALILLFVLQTISGCQRCSVHEDVEKNEKSQQEKNKK